MMTPFVVLIAGALAFAGFCLFKIRQARRELAALQKERERLEAEKAIAETQVKHFETRKRYEENVRHADRTAVLDRLQQAGDLRD